MSVAIWCLALVGPRAAGKSTIGARLGALLGWPAIDGDELVAREVGCSAGHYLAVEGEPAFRRIEERTTLAALDLGPSRVVALGGGAVLSARVRQALLQPGVLTVFLEAPVDVLLERLAASPLHRPSLTTSAMADEVRLLLEQRRPLYMEVARLRLETFPANVDACCEYILAKMRSGR